MTELETKKIEVCILAAGMGSRMKSKRPKVLHPIAGKPMLSHLLDTTASFNPSQAIVVIGNGAELVKSTYEDQKVTWALQAEQLGTGHAVQQAVPHISDDARILMLVGDAPLLRLETMHRLLDVECDLGVLTVNQPNPYNYGRIIRDGKQLVAIVEEKDATDEQRKISEINSGIMVADGKQLKNWLSQLDNNNVQQEYLLTDIIKIANREGASVRAVVTDDHGEVQGVNNLAQLADLEAYYQKREANNLMLSGVHLVDPARFNLRGELKAGQDVSIDINCIIEGKVTIEDDVVIGANCIIKDTHISKGSVIKPNTMLDGATLGEECAIGPYARIRPGSEFAAKVAIGNFVETKKSTLGEGTKSSHLTYLGDAKIGAGVNIGAGTITCNYDGVNKFVTEIADKVFVGSNTSLVAPVKVGEGSTIAAGSTITKEVAEKSLGIARGKQRNINGWTGPRD